jgi:hypothetical protein
MKPFHVYMEEYRKQMEKGDIREAYRGLMEYILKLRGHFEKTFPHFYVSDLYPGSMDMTFFTVVPESLKRVKLKVAIVFIHDTCRFEIWLAGVNKGIQTKFWKLFKERSWNIYRIPLTTKGVDSIVEFSVADNPDFSDLDALTNRIETGTLKFIQDIENFLIQYQ